MRRTHRWRAESVARRRRLRFCAILGSALATCVGFTGLSAALLPVVATGVVPAYQHIFVVAESGQPAAAVIGPATYLTGLAATGALATAHTAVDPSPLADRLALTGGQTGGVTDCTPAQCPQAGDSLATRIEASGRSWRAYAESMPAPCTAVASTDFAPERVPFLYYTSLAAECATNVVPFTQLATDLASAATTPSLAWISPNLQDDMSSSVAQGDAWLQANLAAIFASPAWTGEHSLLVVVGDAPGSASTLATPLPAVFVASDGTVAAGTRSATASTQYDLLSTVEASWALPALTGNDAAAPAMSEVFATQATPTPTPTPSPTPTPTPTAPPTSTPSPTSTPAPTPGSTPTPHPSASPSATPTATPAPSGRPAPSPVPAATPGGAAPVSSGPAGLQASPSLSAPTAGSSEFTITSPVIDVADLTYVGATTIASGSVASLPVLEFTATSLTLSSGSASTPALSMTSPCTTQNGMSITQLSTVPGSATASFSGGVTLYVSSIDFTYLSTTYSLSASSPPASFGPISSGQLTGVAMVAARVTAASTSLPDLQAVAYFQC